MAKAKPQKWKNRIVGGGEKPASEFNFNPLNWREHPQVQRDALNEIFEKIGWVTGVIVNQRTGNLIDGHARVEEALKKDPSGPIPFVEVDLSEEDERTLLLLLDPIGGLAVTNTEKFQQLADSLSIETGGLLEVIAAISRTDLIETASLPRQENGIGELLKYLKFGDVAIPLTDDELAELERRYAAYVEEKGVVFGFAGELLGM
jgi:hypothetical protein